MGLERTSVGLDVHARSVSAAAIDGVTGEVLRQRLVPDQRVVLDWVHSLPGPVAVTYEAGPTGFGLARAFAAAGIGCTVAAPSKIIRPSGDRVKTDARDALLLARLLRLDDIVAVRVPTVAQEAARDLVRAREDARGDLRRVRHRISTLLLRHGPATSAVRPGPASTSSGCAASASPGRSGPAPRPPPTPIWRPWRCPSRASSGWTRRSPS